MLNMVYGMYWLPVIMALLYIETENAPIWGTSIIPRQYRYWLLKFWYLIGLAVGAFGILASLHLILMSTWIFFYCNVKIHKELR